MAGVRSRLESHPQIINPVLESIEAVSQEFLALYQSHDQHSLQKMEQLVDYNQGLLQTLGVSHPALQNIITIFASYGKWSSKYVIKS